MDTKVCSRCQETKLVEEFRVRKLSKDGRSAACKSCLKAGDKVDYERHRPAYIARARRNERRRKDRNPAYRNALNVWKTLKKRKRIPKWVSFDDLLPIYVRCTAMSPDFVVDHVIPLCGKTVSGLHVPENLQIITKKENETKGRSFSG